MQHAAATVLLKLLLLRYTHIGGVLWSIDHTSSAIIDCGVSLSEETINRWSYNDELEKLGEPTLAQCKGSEPTTTCKMLKLMKWLDWVWTECCNDSQWEVHWSSSSVDSRLVRIERAARYWAVDWCGTWQLSAQPQNYRLQGLCVSWLWTLLPRYDGI